MYANYNHNRIAAIDHGRIVGGPLLVAGCNSPELLETIDQPLDAISQAVDLPVEMDHRDDRLLCEE